MVQLLNAIEYLESVGLLTYTYTYIQSTHQRLDKLADCGNGSHEILFII